MKPSCMCIVAEKETRNNLTKQAVDIQAKTLCTTGARFAVCILAREVSQHEDTCDTRIEKSSL